MRQAFSLVELLVVVTIIVVLLALLAPALDKAIYQAELAVCGANLRAVGTSVTAYAVASQRHYPSPPGGRLVGSQFDMLGTEGQPQQDLRPLLVGDYLSPGAFVDPLCGQIDLSYGANNDGTQVFANYSQWYGTRFLGANGGGGMERIGNRFSWSDPYTGRENRFDVLATDFNIVNDPNTGVAADTIQTQAGHADSAGTMAFARVQNGPIFFVFIGTISRWQGPLARGTLDLNAARDDGSVTRVTAARATLADEPRLRRTPISVDDQDPKWRNHIPPAD